MRRVLRLVCAGVAMLGLSALLVAAPPTVTLPSTGTVAQSVDDSMVAPAKLGVSFTPPQAQAALTMTMKIINDKGSVLSLRVHRPGTGLGDYWVTPGYTSTRQVSPTLGVSYFCNSGTKMTVVSLFSGNVIHRWDCPTNSDGGGWRNDTFHTFGVRVIIQWG